MARIFLENPEEEILGGTANTIFGTNGAETVTISANSKAQFDQSFNRGNDTIIIQGAAALYTASVVGGSNLLLTAANGANILIPFSDDDTQIQFADGEDRGLVFEGGKLLLGDLEIALTGETELDPTGPGSNPNLIRLTVGNDLLDGTGADDEFRARVAQNANGEQANQLGSGDELDGGAGDDLLNADVQDASPLNSGPTGSIEPITVDIERAYFDAEANYDVGESDGSLGVEINSSEMWGLEEIGSVDSDTALTIYNLTTLQDDGDYDNRRATEAVSIIMDHTGNGDSIHPAADLTVLFDQDYLIANAPGEQNSSLTLQLLDIDNEINSNQPLLTNPFDQLRFGLTVDGVRTVYTIDIVDGTSELTGAAAYQQLVDAINDALVAEGLPDLVAELGGSFQVVDPDGSPGGLADGFNIVITNTAEGTLDAVGFIASGVIPPNTDYQKEVFPTPPEQIEELITTNIILEKVGRVSDADDIDLGIGGGDLTVGGMATNFSNILGDGGEGVEQFDITVRGDETEPSSLASLQSTNNELREVYIESATGSEADLVIGNYNTFEQANGALDSAYGEGSFDENIFDVTTARNNALKDVLILDSTGANSQGVGAFVNDLTINAYFSDEVVEKYLDVVDGAPDASADDQDALYTLGEGNDTVNVNLSDSNFVSLGNETRDDFSFTVFTNGGDDLVQIQIGDGFNEDEGEGDPQLPDVDAWYQDHVISENLTINTGAGDDKVETWGASAADIVLGAGDDVAITDDSGEVEFFDPEFADEDEIQSAYNATWAFNTETGPLNNSIIDPLSEDAAAIANLANLTLTVTFQDIESTVNVGTTVNAANGATVTDLTINQAIKDAINNDEVLSNILVAEDGPGRTLFVRSLIDGQHLNTDLTLSLGVSGALTGAQTAPGSTATLLGSLTPAQLALLGITVTGTGTAAVGTFTANRYDSEFATTFGGIMDGNDSTQVNNDQVEGGTGNDLIVLSSGFGSVETIDINGVFNDDVVLNFTATIAGAATAEVQTFTVGADATVPGSFTVSAFGITTLPIPFAAGDLAADIADDIEQALIAAGVAAQGTIVQAGNVVTVTSNDPGTDETDATFAFAGTAEQQTIDFTGVDGDVAAGETVTVFFAGIGGPAGITYTITAADIASATPIDEIIAAGLATAFNAVTAPDVASSALSVLTLTNNVAGNVPSASVLTNTDVDYIVTTITEGNQNTFPLTAASVDGLAPEIGYDIFDVETVLGGAVTAVDNDQQVDGPTVERDSIAGVVAGSRIVAITDTLEADDYAFDAASTTELLRVQEIVRETDTAAQATATTGLVITVNADNVGTFYLVNDGVGAGDATATRLGSVELGQYDLPGKEAIGEWDAMSLVNFNPLTPSELLATFDGQSF